MNFRIVTDDAARRACRCCGGKRVVADIVGEPRPCSRCDVFAFARSASDRRPQPQPAERSAL